VPKIISERCELVNLCHINRSGPGFFVTQCSRRSDGGGGRRKCPTPCKKGTGICPRREHVRIPAVSALSVFSDLSLTTACDLVCYLPSPPLCLPFDPLNYRIL